MHSGYFSGGLILSCSRAKSGGPAANDPMTPGNKCSGSGVAPQPLIPLHTMGQQKYFWIPGTGVFATGNANLFCLGCGVAPHTHAALHTRLRKRWFWIPGMGLFAMDNVKEYCFGSGVASQTHTPLQTMRRKGVFEYPRWGCLNCTSPKNIVCVLGWRSKHPYHCTP